MALIYHPNLEILFAGSIMRGLANTNSSSGGIGAHSFGISVYSGAVPTPALFITNWTTYNYANSNFLAHYLSSSWSQPAQGNLLQMFSPPTATPNNTGSAAWAVIWGTTALNGVPPTLPQIQSGTIPTTCFMIVNVSDSLGDGVVRFVSTAFTTGTPVTIFDGTIAVNL
jgi:hypothetical protein